MGCAADTYSDLDDRVDGLGLGLEDVGDRMRSQVHTHDLPSHERVGDESRCTARTLSLRHTAARKWFPAKFNGLLHHNLPWTRLRSALEPASCIDRPRVRRLHAVYHALCVPLCAALTLAQQSKSTRNRRRTRSLLCSRGMCPREAKRLIKWSLISQNRVARLMSRRTSPGLPLPSWTIRRHPRP